MPVKDIAPDIIDKEIEDAGSGNGPDELPLSPAAASSPSSLPTVIVPPAPPATPIGTPYVCAFDSMIL